MYIDLDIIKIVHAKASIKKYLIAASVAYGHNLIAITGIKESKFSSRPIQAPNQDEEEIDKKVPVNNVHKNNK